MSFDISHHIKGIRPALQAMNELGYSSEDCLSGSGITFQQLESSDPTISLEQEFDFYRNLLNLTGNPAIGLHLGRAFRLESYGVFGYAILSAETLRDGLMIASQYGALSFSWFDISLREENEMAYFQMSRRGDLPNDLLQVYEDRDCSAIVSGTVSALGQLINIHEIHLMHCNEEAQRQVYQDFFKCPIKFGQDKLSLLFDASVLDQKMPLRDPSTAEYCRQQCELLLRKAKALYSLSDQVSQCLRSSIREFGSAAKVAESLGISERSLRRKLEEEETSFKHILTRQRQALAQELLKSEMGLEQIADSLGYSEAANFSHAFKRWFGMSPTQYRLAYCSSEQR